MIEHLKANYGYLFEGELLQEINQVGVFKKIPGSSKLIEIGDYIKSMPLLISGVVKIRLIV